MSVVCPHCQNALEVVEAAAGEVLCPSCGSSFRLDQGSTTGWDPSERPKKVGKFELLEMVGGGAFGTVYKARDTELDRIVAVKVPRLGSLGSSGSDTGRFLREARSVAQLRHPSIVAVHEVGQHEGVPFLVEDFVAGITLADLLTSERLPCRQAAELIADVADALQYAHDQGVVHRDVKPSNIILETGRGGSGKNQAAGAPAPLSLRPAPKLMDFGLAKRDAGEVSVTVEGQVLGTPAYMSPEQARGESHQVDGRSDVYSLGVILYQLLTGSLPFKGNARMLLHHVLHDEPPRPRQRDSQVPRDLETICLKAMAKEPARRYPSARALAEDLRRFVNNEPIQARPVGCRERLVKWVRRRPAAAALMAMTVLMAAAGIGVGVWAWRQEQLAEAARQEQAERARAADEVRRLKIEYFANTTRRWGALEGIGPISATEARRRELTYKFYRRAGRVEKVEVLNGSGAYFRWGSLGAYISADAQNPECRYDYRRDHEGRVIEEVARDRNGQVMWVFHVTAHGPDRSTGQYTNERGFVRPRSGSGAAYVEITWTAEGWEKEIRYLDRHDRRVPIQDKTYGLRQKFDARGLPVEKTFLDPKDQPMEQYSHARVLLRYDSRGNVIETAYHGLDGQFTTTSGVARVTHGYDDHGNQVAIAFFGPDGKPILNSARYARATFAYDDRGNAIARAYFGLDGKPMLTGGGFARATLAYDDHGNMIEGSLFDAEGKLTHDNRGIARVTIGYDDRGNMIKVAYFGVDGKPALSTQLGCASQTFAYDKRGRLTQIAYFGLNGKPTRNRDGYARQTWAYDDHGRIIETAYYGLNGKFTLNNYRYARATFDYDDRDNPIETQFFGVDAKPALATFGYARITQTYDRNGNRIGTAFFGVDGQPVHGLDGYSSSQTRYDQLDRPLEHTYAGYDGRNGFAQRRTKLDAKGREIEETFLDTQGKMVLCTGGFARVARTFNAAGKVIAARYLGLDGKAVRLEFLRDWLVLAPFPLKPGQNGAAALAPEQIASEANLRPREGERVRVGGKELVWTRYRPIEYFLDFNELLGRTTEYSLAYAVCYVTADSELHDLMLKVGSDDQVKVYLNGQPLLSHTVPRSLKMDDNMIPHVHLRKGTNVLVLKVVNERRDWSACARFTGKDGKPVPNLKVTRMRP